MRLRFANPAGTTEGCRGSITAVDANSAEQNGSASLPMARTLSLTALLHKYDGDYAAGPKLVDQALMIQRSRDPIHPDVAVALQIRGDLLYLSGEISMEIDPDQWARSQRTRPRPRTSAVAVAAA